MAGSTLLAASGAMGWYLSSKKAPIGFAVDEKTLERGRNFLNKHISVDIHAHPGRSFVKRGEHLSPNLTLYSALGSFEQNTIQDMITGGLSMASFATVADFQLLDLTKQGLKATREYKEGEAWQSYQIQIATLQALLKNQSVIAILKPDDIIKAKKSHRIGAFFTSEGADFLEGSLENFDQCYQDGIRSMTLVHYHINEVGDIQTEPPRHKTLTPFGHSLVRAMNKKGMIIDLAHMEKNTALKVLEITEKPVMNSHTAIRRSGFDSNRFIDFEDAKGIAETGGIIGAWPAGIGLSTLDDYIDQIFRTVDDLGINHVSLGTDMDATYKPVFDTYLRLPLLAGTLLQRGMHEEEAAKLLGGNFTRLFKATYNSQEYST